LIYSLSIISFSPRYFRLWDFEVPLQVLVAMFGGLLFAVHPLQTQAVTYTVQRIAAMVALFYILSLLGYVRFRRASWAWSRIGWAVFSVLAGLLAVHSKENAITLPLAILVLEAVFFTGGIKSFVSRIPKLIPWLLLGLVIPAYMLGVSQFINGGWGAEEIPLLVAPSTWQAATQESSNLEFSRSTYLLTQFNVVRTYMRLLVLPINQALDYDYVIEDSLFDISTVSSLGLEIALLALAVWFLIKRYKLAAFGIFFFFIALLPESSLVPIADVIFEHRVYLPFLGFSLLLSDGLFWVLKRYGSRDVFEIKVVWFILALLLLYLVLLGVATYERNKVWQGQVAFWEDAAEKSPDKARPHNNLGLYYYGSGDDGRAEKEFLRALELDTEYPEAFNNLGMINIRKGDTDKAEGYLNRALELKPRYSHAFNNLGAIYVDRGDLEKAEKAFRDALDIDARYSGARDNLGMVLIRQGRFDEAERELLLNLEHFPDFAGSYVNLGVVYFNTGYVNKAREQFKKALEINPGQPNARENLRIIDGSRSPNLNFL